MMISEQNILFILCTLCVFCVYFVYFGGRKKKMTFVNQKNVYFFRLFIGTSCIN